MGVAAQAGDRPRVRVAVGPDLEDVAVVLAEDAGPVTFRPPVAAPVLGLLAAPPTPRPAPLPPPVARPVPGPPAGPAGSPRGGAAGAVGRRCRRGRRTRRGC